jgi:hypothetical protein
VRHGSQAGDELEATTESTEHNKEKAAALNIELADVKAAHSVLLTDLEVLKESLATEASHVQEVSSLFPNYACLLGWGQRFGSVGLNCVCFFRFGKEWYANLVAWVPPQ